MVDENINGYVRDYNLLAVAQYNEYENSNRPRSGLNRGKMSGNRMSSSGGPHLSESMAVTSVSRVNSRPSSSSHRGRSILSTGRRTPGSRPGSQLGSHLSPGVTGPSSDKRLPFPSRPNSSLSSVGGDTVYTGDTSPSRPPPPPRPTSAWQMFEDQIKEIDDSSPLFARR